MKKWGFYITAYYVLVIVALLWPLYFLFMFGDEHYSWERYIRTLRDMYGNWYIALPFAVVVVGQFLLLFLTVDTTNRRLRPRAPIFLPAVLTGLFTAVLAFAACTSLIFAWKADWLFDYFEHHHGSMYAYLLVWPLLWIAWGFVFYLYARKEENPISRAVSWLLKGSILEFLIVLPCHIVVRRRGDCCAPAGTSLGICSGIAVMLLAFGPSVILLYKKRLDSYASRRLHPQ